MPQDPNAARLSYVLGKNPELAYQPATAMALSYSSAKDDDLDMTSAYLRGKRITEALNGLPPSEQIRYWQSMNQNDKNMTTASGYLLPIDSHEVEHQNALESGAGKVFGFIGKFTPNAVEKPLKATLHAYSDVVENTVQRGIRSVIIGAGEAGDSEQSWGAGAFDLLDVSSYGRWWRASDKDNAPIEAGAEGRIRDRFGDGMVDLIRAEQKKPGFLTSEFERLVSAGDTEQAQRLDDTMRSEQFGEAFKQLENARVSVGRLLPQMLHLEDNEKMFNILSGPIDGAWRLGTDPLNRFVSPAETRIGPLQGPQILPKLRELRESSYVIPKFDDVKATAAIDDAFAGADKASQNVIRYFDDMGSRMETIRNGTPKEAGEAFRDLRTNFKKTMPIYDMMMKAGVKDATTAKAFLLEEKNYRHILSGNKANPRGIMPYRRALAARVQPLKTKPGSIVDFLERGDRFTRDSLEEAAGTLDQVSKGAADADAVKALQSAAGAKVKDGNVVTDWKNGWRARSATAMRRINTPTVKLDDKGHLNLMGDDAAEQVRRIASYYGPKFWADQVAATFSKSTDVVMRKNIVKGLMETMGEATGLTKTLEGRAWLDQFVKKMDDEVAGSYSIGPAGQLVSGERSAWMLEDARPYLPVPSFKEFHAQAAKVGVTKQLWGIANHDLVDTWMNTYWRPAMLLRPATAIRNAIDENANLIVRNGAKTAVTQRAELRLANKAQYERRMVAKSEATTAADRAAALEAKLNEDFPDIAQAPKKRLKELEKAQDDAQILHARYKGTAGSVDPTAGRLFRMYSNSANFLLKKIGNNHPLAINLKKFATGETVHDLYMGHLYGMLSEKWMKYGAKSEDAAKLNAYLGDLVDDPFFRSRIEQDMIGSAKDSISENTRVMDTLVKGPGKKGKYNRVVIDTPGKMVPQGTNGARAWSQHLNKMADNELGHLAFLHLDNEAKAIRLMVRAIKENPDHAANLRALRDRTPEEFAAQVFTEIKMHLSDSAGNLNKALAKEMVQKANGVRTLDRNAFTPEKLNEIPLHGRPEHIIGRDSVLVPDGGGLYDLVQRGFEFFGEMTAYLSRHPQMVDEYLNVRQSLEGWQQGATQALAERMAAPGTRILRHHHGETDLSGARLQGVHYAIDRADYDGSFDVFGDTVSKRVGLNLKDSKVLKPEAVTVRTASGERQLNAGASALAHLEPKKFDEFWKPSTSKNAVLAEAKRRFPRQDWDGYASRANIDKERLIEAYGANVAREKGYRAIYNKDAGSSSLDEYLALTDDAADDVAVVGSDIDKVESRAAEIVRRQAHKMAVEKGTERVLDYVDNPAIRSQASVIFRNIAPFYRAQEEFFRRWARTMKYSPEMFARANLYLDGLDNSGMFFTDDQGTKYFLYPGTKVLSQGLAEIGQKFGVPMDILPVPVPMTGKVNMLAPGFQSEQWTKVFNGPIHAIPVSVMEKMTGDNARIKEFQRWAYGDVAAGANPVVGVLPSAIRPAVDALVNRKEVMFAAQKQAMAYLQANGQGLPPNPSPQQRQEFLEKTRRHALGVVVTRALMAPNVPAAPRAGSSSAPSTPQADVSSKALGMRYIDDRYHALIEKVGFEDAYGYWMQAHPEEVPFLTGSTEGDSPAFLPMTKRAYEFMNSNRDIMTRYKKAAGFLVPQEPGDTDMGAWQLAMDLGIRRFKDINSYLDDIIIAKDLNDYYDRKDVFEAEVAKAKANGVPATQLREAWKSWKDQWMPFHPLVEQHINDGNVRQQNREETLTELGEMFNDPDVPMTPSLSKMRDLTEMYYALEAGLAPLAQNRDDASLARKSQMRELFHTHAKALVSGDAGAEMLYQRVFRYLEND